MKFFARISKTRGFAIAQAFFVTILWSSSWPIIKFGLKDENLTPFNFAGLRYLIAASILITAVLFSSKHRKEVKKLSKRWWLKLIIYGLIFYTITQGAQFFGLTYLEAIDVSLLLSFTPMLVLIAAIFMIKEIPNYKQIILVIIALIGALLYFIPMIEIDLTFFVIIALIVVIIGIFANTISAIMGRAINKLKEFSPLVITAISMFIGAIVLLILGFSIEGIPTISWVALGYILWLSVVNTAFAFTLWNQVMQKLKAVEISIINNTMTFQITILAVIFLSERPSSLQWVGLILVALSGLILPLFGTKKDNEINETILNDTKNEE